MNMGKPTTKQIEFLKVLGESDEEIAKLDFEGASKRIGELAKHPKKVYTPKMPGTTQQSKPQPQANPPINEKKEGEPSSPNFSPVKPLTDPELDQFIEEAKLFIVEHFGLKPEEISVDNQLLAVLVRAKLQMQSQRFQYAKAKSQREYWGER